MTSISVSENRSQRPIRLGMVGGGSGAFIGAVHRMASRLDGRFQLVAGALSSSPEKSKLSGSEIGLDPGRSYATFKEMAAREARRKDGIEAVAIVTPNHLHYLAAKEFLKRGVHVICDKPLTSNLSDARKLKLVAEKSGALFILSHNYTGYPLIRQAREMISAGELGRLRIVQVEYAQDWLTDAIEQGDAKGAQWRTDPARSGAGGSTGDIGTHAFNLARFVTGLQLESLSADIDCFVPGRRLDDNAHVLMRFDGGIKGMLWCSQVAPGNENNLRIRVYGDRAGLEWSQEDPNRLWFTPFGETKRLITRGGAGANVAAQRVSRVPAGHPEGYIEAFATIYAEAAIAIDAKRNGMNVDGSSVLPSIDDGLEGVAFIEACVSSSRLNGRWTKLRI